MPRPSGVALEAVLAAAFLLLAAAGALALFGGATEGASGQVAR